MSQLSLTTETDNINTLDCRHCTFKSYNWYCMILQDKNNSPRCWHSFLWLARLTLNTDTVHLTQHEHRCHSFLWLARHGGRQNKARPDRHLKNNSNDSRKTTESVIWKPIGIVEFFPPHQNTSDPESAKRGKTWTQADLLVWNASQFLKSSWSEIC